MTNELLTQCLPCTLDGLADVIQRSIIIHSPDRPPLSFSLGPGPGIWAHASGRAKARNGLARHPNLMWLSQGGKGLRCRDPTWFSDERP